MSKTDIVKHIINEYGMTSLTDIIDALKDLLGKTFQEMLNEEFNEHMEYDKHNHIVEKNNYRNGSSKKMVKTSQGNIKLDISHDRNTSFNPIIIEKHNRDISDVNNKIINLYARGMSIRGIGEAVNDIYGIHVSGPP